MKDWDLCLALQQPDPIAPLEEAMSMHWDVTAVYLQGDTALKVQFLPSAFRGVFAQLKDPLAFRQARVEDGVLTWPGELDLAPDAMHEAISAHGKWVLD